jgi:hypothetical protein
MEESEEMPGAVCPPRDDKPYETIDESEEIPGSTLSEDNPYETIEESEEMPGAVCPPRDDKP